MTTAVYFHPACQSHDTGPGHPERPARLDAILDALRAPELRAVQWREAPRAEIDQLGRVHPGRYVDGILGRIPARGLDALDPDTVVSPGSGEAALRAAGAACAAVDAVLSGELDSAFCAVRPPGHHAEPDRAMGFCLFNSVAVAAMQAIDGHGLERVAIVDFDVHHGNGTQAAFERRPQVLYVSTHQSPLYPGTGRPRDEGAGNILNLPLPPFAGSRELREAWSGTVLPRLRAFSPQLILVSAGFDAHAADPLAQLEFETGDYAWMTEQLLAIAREHCAGRIVSSLEGGYDLDALAASAVAHVRSLLRPV